MTITQTDYAAIDYHIHRETPFGRVYWDKHLRYVHTESTMYSEGQEFRDGCETVLEAIAEHKARRLLTDSRHLGLISVDDQRWMDEVWMPRFLVSGITKLAVVPPLGAIGRMSIANVAISVPGSHVTMATLGSVAEALVWLIKA
jgi:hypothetical protein